MEFASEMVIKATLLKMKISEVPTTLSPDGRTRPPHLRPWRDGWRHLVFMLVYSPRWLFLYPGILLCVLGLFTTAWLWGGPQKTGGLNLDVHTMIYAAMAVLIGFHSISFAILSKVFAIQEGLRLPDPRLDRFFKIINLEVGVIVGVVLILAGFVGSVAAVRSWSLANYGSLNPAQTMRLVIPSALALTLGIETILVSFFLSILGLRVRRLTKVETP